MIKQLIPPLATTLAAAFFGIALYIILAEQPARLALDDGALLAQWKVSFNVGFLMQGATAIVAGVAGLAAWWIDRNWRWLVGGLLMLANWPWTLIVIAPINNALLATAPEAAGPDSRALIEQWANVHAGRALFSFLAVVLFLWSLSKRPAAHNAP
ncbi:MAG: DUF1772 domain-containing protein [Aestuariivirga sp.]